MHFHEISRLEKFYISRVFNFRFLVFHIFSGYLISIFSRKRLETGSKTTRHKKNYRHSNHYLRSNHDDFNRHCMFDHFAGIKFREFKISKFFAGI